MISSSIRQRKGQDFSRQTEGDNWEAVVIADGISATYRAEWAAQFAVNILIEKIDEQNGVFTHAILNEAFCGLPELMRTQLQAEFGDSLTEQQLAYGFSTTLLCGIRQDETYWFAYVGNGGIIHLRNHYYDKPTSYPVPWSAVNLLNPHTVEQDGQERLYRYISPRELNTLAVPTILSVTDREGHGDYFILCTDGIFSADHVPFAMDDENEIWLKYDARLSQLYTLIRKNRQPTDEHLVDYLTQLNAQNQLDDDATISIMWHHKTLIANGI